MVCPTLAIEAGADAPARMRRTSNEEACAALPCLGLFVVAGGVGGEVVSRTAVEVVRAGVEAGSLNDVCAAGMTASRCRDEVRLMVRPRRTGRFSPYGDGPAPGRGAAEVIFAGALLAPGAVYIVHIGGLRVYRIRCGDMEERTCDLAALDGMSAGAVSPGALAILTQHASAATRALGCEAAVEATVQVERTEPGDIFLVCSSGLWGSVPEHRIAGILAAHRDLRLAASLLMDCAHERGEPEQVTCILARVGDII